jgi:hypothetical protein
MVGFWLLNGTEQTPLAQWGWFAAAYLPLVLLEPVLTLVLVRLIKQSPQGSWLHQWSAVDRLQLG